MQSQEKVLENVWEALVQSQVKFNRDPKKLPGKVPGGFGAEPGQVQQAVFNMVSKKVPERVLGWLWSERVPEKVWEALVQSQVKFSKVPGKIPEKVPGGFGAVPRPVQ